MMNSAGKFREYAAECVQRATDSPSMDDKNLHLNMALAWVRLAHQSETLDQRLDALDEAGLNETELDETALDETATPSDDESAENNAGAKSQ